MPQDAFTLKYLCDELNELLKGGKVNRITEPTNDELVLTIYTGKRTEKLLLNVNPSSPRIGVIEREMESPLTAPNFCMLMRKHLLSATLDSVELVGFDRIVKFNFTASAEFFDAVKKTLYVELMGRYSNIILTENGKILGGNRGINMFDNGVRPLIVGLPYVFPPTGDKKLPNDESLIDYFNAFDGQNFAEYICKGVQGIAPSTAQEILHLYLKSGKSIESGFAKDFFEFFNDFLFNCKLNPCVTLDNGKVMDVSVFPYQKVTGEKIFFDSLYKAEEYYFTRKETAKKYSQKKERLTSVVNTAIKKIKKRITAITAKERDALSADENRLKGELILANIYKIKQGDSQVELDNYYDGTTIKIELDQRLSPSKNSENYYKKYNKQKRTLTALEPQKNQAQQELDYYLSVLDEISIAEDIDELNLIASELEQVGVLKVAQTQKRKKQQENLYNNYLINGFTVKAGRNNLENDKLTFSSKPKDLWLHAKDYHSSHVIIETCGKVVPIEVIKIAGEICGYYSKARESGKVEISYTEKKNVKKNPGGKFGSCHYEHYQTILVEPQKHAEKIKR